MTLEALDASVDLSGRRVLAGVSLAAMAGEIVAVVGPNGAGKSTLLRVLAGLLPLAGGQVLLNGRPPATWELRALGRHIAYLPQDRAVHWPLSVASVVALGRLPHAGRFATLNDADRRAIDAAMTAMDVATLGERPVTRLSGGERARVLVARALAQEARVMVADEPTVGLDPAHALALFGHLSRLAAEGRAIVIATHDLSMAARYASKAVLLKAGAVVAWGPPSQVFTEAVIADAFDVHAALGIIDGVPVVLPARALTR